MILLMDLSFIILYVYKNKETLTCRPVNTCIQTYHMKKYKSNLAGANIVSASFYSHHAFDQIEEKKGVTDVLFVYVSIKYSIIMLLN